MYPKFNQTSQSLALLDDKLWSKPSILSLKKYCHLKSIIKSESTVNLYRVPTLPTTEKDVWLPLNKKGSSFTLGFAALTHGWKKLLESLILVDPL